MAAPSLVAPAPPASVPQPPVVTSSQQPVPTQPAPLSSNAKPRLSGSISIKLNAVPQVERPRLKVDVTPLSQEYLLKVWQEVLLQLQHDEPQVAQLLQHVAIHLEGPSLFRIETHDAFFEHNFRPYQVSVLERLRDTLTMPLLNCRIALIEPQHEAVAYSPADKYDAMCKINPLLARLRQTFTDIDY